MVSAVLFAAHLFFIALIFVKRYQIESFSNGILNVCFIIIFFTVLWSVSYSIFPAFINEKGLGLYYNLDDIIMSIVSTIEAILYYLIYKDDFDNK
jgi:hypothetical protein